MPHPKTRLLKARADEIAKVLEEIDDFDKAKQKAESKRDDGIKGGETVAKQLLDSLKQMKRDFGGAASDAVDKAIKELGSGKGIFNVTTRPAAKGKLPDRRSPVDASLENALSAVKNQHLKSSKLTGAAKQVDELMDKFEDKVLDLTSLQKNVPTEFDLEMLREEVNSKLGEIELLAEGLLEDLGALPVGRVD